MTDQVRDPTREEMQEFLATQTCGEDCTDDIEVAMFWFAMYWHGGQGSNLYSVMSASPFSPGPVGRLESESGIVQFMYYALEAEYKISTDHVRRGPVDDSVTAEVAVDP